MSSPNACTTASYTASSGKIEPVRQRVGLEKVRPAPGQHQADRRLAARHPAGEAYPQHCGVASIEVSKAFLSIIPGTEPKAVYTGDGR